MLTHQITKDLQKTLLCAEKQIGKTNEMIDEGINAEQVQYQYLAAKQLLEKAGSSQLIHLLRDELDKRINHWADHPNLTERLDNELERMYNQINHYAMDEFAQVFDRLKKIGNELNGR